MVICCDRTVKGRSGGGVRFYIRSYINYVVRQDLDNQLLEILSIEINLLLLLRGTDHRQIHLLIVFRTSMLC